jgi:16S rRNA (cytosine1402-N4)-methyltransferase
MSEFHEPVLLDSVVRLLAPAPGKVFVDGTLGGAGHAQAILPLLLPGGFLIGIDRDEEAIREASERLHPFRENCLLVHDDFSNLARIAAQMKFRQLDGVLVDLGVSSHQLNAGERGFSFLRPGPLDMRFSRSSGKSGSRGASRGASSNRAPCGRRRICARPSKP